MRRATISDWEAGRHQPLDELRVRNLVACMGLTFPEA
jgi:hypothetical protein